MRLEDFEKLFLVLAFHKGTQFEEDGRVLIDIHLGLKQRQQIEFQIIKALCNDRVLIFVFNISGSLGFIDEE